MIGKLWRSTRLQAHQNNLLSYKEANESIVTHRSSPTVLLDRPFIPFTARAEKIQNETLMTDDPCEYEIYQIHGFQSVWGQKQVICDYYTKDGKFENYPIKLNDVPCEVWIDCMVDNDLDSKLIEKKIVLSKYLAKLKLPSNYRLKYAVGDNIKVRFENDDTTYDARVIDTDPIEYACQLSPEYQISLVINNNNNNNNNETTHWVHEYQCRGLRETLDFDLGFTKKIWYNVERAKKYNVRSYVRKNMIDADILPYDLDIKSVFYGKPDKIILNFEVTEESANKFYEDVSFMIEKCIDNIIKPGMGITTVAAKGTKKRLYSFGVRMTPVTIWSYLFPLIKDMDGSIKYSLNSIVFSFEAAKLYAKLKKDYTYPIVGGGSMKVLQDMTITWNRHYEILFVRKFKYETENQFT